MYCEKILELTLTRQCLRTLGNILSQNFDTHIYRLYSGFRKLHSPQSGGFTKDSFWKVYTTLYIMFRFVRVSKQQQHHVTWGWSRSKDCTLYYTRWHHNYNIGAFHCNIIRQWRALVTDYTYYTNIHFTYTLSSVYLPLEQ